MMRIIDAINGHLHEGKCPTAGSLGECAAISTLTCKGSTGPHYVASLYIWDKTFNDSTLVASWFRQLGAYGITVSAVLFDEGNDIRDGASTHDDARPWDVGFFMPDDLVDY